MKTSTFRKMTALVLSIMLVLSMCMTGISVSAAEGTKTVYFQVSNNWLVDNARFAAYTWANGSDGTFASMTKVEEGIYSANVSANCPNIIFTRMNPSTANNDWNNVWNQTADLTIPADKDLFKINEGEWNGANGTWSNYKTIPTTPTAPTTQPITNPVTDSTIFFAPNSNWTQANARFAMYMWNNSGDKFVSMTKNTDGVYTAELADGFTNVIFVRMNPETTTNDWNNMWNQTTDLTVPQGKNFFTANQGEWDGINGTWSTYVTPTEPTTVKPTAPTTVPTAPTTEPTEPTTESTEPTTHESGFTYTILKDGTAEINAYNGNTVNMGIIIPEEIDGYTVTSIGNGAFWNSNLTEVIIADTVTNIGMSAFRSCPNLSKVKLSNNLTTIKTLAFYECKSLTTVTIPSSVTYIDIDAFEDCTGLKEVVFNANNEAIICGGAFSGCKNLETVTLSGKITTIGQYAFGYCSSLKEINLPNGVETLQTNAFSDSGLTKITIPASVTTIEDYALPYFNEGLVVYGYTGTVAEEHANKANLTFVALDASEFTYTVYEGNVYISGYTGNDSAITIPATIDGYEVQGINNNAFQNNTNLTSVTFEEGIRYIGYYAFDGCTNLKEVNLPESLTTIDAYAFCSCESLEEVVLPKSVTYVRVFAFALCPNLKKVTILSKTVGLVDTYGSVFSQSSPTIYGYTGSSAEDYANRHYHPFVALDASEFTYKVLDDGTAEITGYTGNDSTVVIPATIDGYKVTSIGSYTISSYYNEDRTALVISEGIKTIKSTAFSNWYSLKEVQLPESLETIGTEAFYYCQNLETINFPDNLVSIGDGAFSYCSKIKEVSITGGKLTLVDDWAFNRCDSIESVTLNGNNAEIGSYAFNDCVNLTSLTLNGIKILGEQTFDCCNLKNVVLPDGLEKMDYSTFASNTNLMTVVVPQSVTYMQTSTFYDVADNFTMLGYTGSYAETFVKNNPMLGITFIALDKFEYELLEDGTIKVTDYFGEGDTLVIPSTIDGYQVSIFDGSSFGQNKYDVKKLVLGNGIKKVAGYACYHWSKLEEVYLADSIEYIYDYAFNDCENLTTINFPANLEYIGEFAFRFCSNLKIAEITGGKLTYIDYGAFEDCPLLNTVTIKGNNTAIDSYAFYNCTRLIKLKLDGIKSISYSSFNNLFITELVLPEGLERIESSSFSNCTFLKSVVIPKSITHEISYGTFADNLTIYGYTGSRAEEYANYRGFTFIPLDGGADITGDIDLKLLKTDENIYSADIELQAGTYKFNVDNAGTVLGFNKTFTDTATIDYSGGFKAQSTLVATGGRYTFTFNTSTKKLTIKHQAFDDIVELKGGINTVLVRPNKNTTVFTGTVKLDAGTYYFNVYEGGQIYGLDYLFEDVIYDHPFNWTTPTGFKATGGTYSVRYDSATNKLKILHTPAGLGDVTIFGDINIPLANQGNGLYSAQTVLDAGSYEIRVDSFGTIFANGSKFTNSISTTFNSNWKAAATLTVTEKMKFTFTFNTNTNKVVVYNSPIDTTKVKVAFDDIDALGLTSVDGVTYTGKIILTAGTYTFRMDEFGVPMGGNYTFTDNKSGLYYNETYASATTMTATGGTYTFSYNTKTNFLTVTKG